VTEGLITLYNTPGGPVFGPQQADSAARLTAAWARTALNGTPLASLDLREISGLLRRLLDEVEGVCWAHLETVDSSTQTARMLREIGFAEWTRSAGSTLPLDNFPTLRAAIEQQRLAIITRDALPAASAERDWLARRGGDVCLIVPLLNRGTTIGAFLLLDQKRSAFDGEEINLAQGIANVVSSALENARLYESLQSRARALESAYTELQGLDRAKDQFIQNVSHELRTPLIHVLGYAGLLADGTFGPITDEQSEALHSIAEKGQQVADIVEDMVAAQAQDAQTFEFAPVDITALIRDVLQAHDARIQGMRLRLTTHFQNGLPPVRADARMIASAFEKLLDNALKFGAEGGRLEVAIRDTDGPLIQVALRDYGVGISPSEHEKIFHRFYQVDGGLSRQYGGAGLGLAVARSIVEAHGGRISVKSRPNEGSIFYFTLPKYNLGQHQADNP
jgi:signal transduction histidine kinase